MNFGQLNLQKIIQELPPNRLSAAMMRIVIVLLVSQGIAWINSFLYPNGGLSFFINPISIIVNLSTVVYVIVVAISIARRNKSIALIVLLSINAFSVLVLNFSEFYWSIGTAANFNQALTHLSAIYFTLGTLTTAGTGVIAAKSELAIGAVCLQMVIDLVLAVGVIGIVTSRLSERPTSSPSS